MNKLEGMMAKEKGKITKPYLIIFFLNLGISMYPSHLLDYKLHQAIYHTCFVHHGTATSI